MRHGCIRCLVSQNLNLGPKYTIANATIHNPNIQAYIIILPHHPLPSVIRLNTPILFPAASIPDIFLSSPSTALLRIPFSFSRDIWNASEEDLSWLARVKRLVVRDSCSLRWVARADSFESIGGAVVAGVGFGPGNFEVDVPVAMAASVAVVVEGSEALSGRRCLIVVVSCDDERLSETSGSGSASIAPFSTGTIPSHISSSTSKSCMSPSSSSRPVLLSTSSLIQSNLSLTFSYRPFFFVRSVVRSCRIAGAFTAGNERSIFFIRVCA